MFFSMMNMGQAYVTEMGRLIGVVGLKELRDYITNPDAIMKAKRQRRLDLEKTLEDDHDQDQEKGDGEVDKNGKSEQGCRCSGHTSRLQCDKTTKIQGKVHASCCEKFAQ